jgi:hypothetical protein
MVVYTKMPEHAALPAVKTFSKSGYNWWFVIRLAVL